MRVVIDTNDFCIPVRGHAPEILILPPAIFLQVLQMARHEEYKDAYS